MLKIVITSQTEDWDIALEDIQFMVNNTVSEVTNETLHFFLYGYQKWMPLALLDNANHHDGLTTMKAMVNGDKDLPSTICIKLGKLSKSIKPWIKNTVKEICHTEYVDWYTSLRKITSFGRPKL